MGIDHLSPDKQYQLYILEVKTQLKDAKKQAERIPQLEKTSQMTYEEWYEIYKHKFESQPHKHSWGASWDNSDNYR